MSGRVCIAQGCGRPLHRAKRYGWCSAHYYRWYKGTRGVPKRPLWFQIAYAWDDPSASCRAGHSLGPGTYYTAPDGSRSCAECSRTFNREWARRRYHTDPEYRARRIAHTVEWQQRVGYHRRRYENPEYRVQLMQWVNDWKRTRAAKAVAYDRFLALSGAPADTTSDCTSKARAFDALIALTG